ncbi:uncharacterized protein P174DRAFT_462044 [Aspergillus novofumigatus IBT 16806]|uniref:Uncharacterized protein n=1 Tax=Aspergillus novofumigatus (strain IBT 16806) TaxID=1392255 RepID=A0A2I1C1K9_ASPN1|nr:uncharacterized protein P174DRAFT_462044 [Aspergillus novofumigatus IBT 16806]PKX91499.1 hypothetical protein P174DRAFT_462044 [Aspergillus novofumigatus IBT 16806]
MLLRFLSLAVVCLSRVTASLPDYQPSQISDTPHSRHLYRLDMPDALQNPHSRSHVTLEFFTDNGTLYANHEPIFPSILPQQFPAIKYWPSGEAVRGYRVWGRLLGNTLLLKLRLFDLHGRPITPDLIAVGFTRQNGSLRIIKVERSPFYRHGYANGAWQLFQTHVRPRLDALTGTKDSVSWICPSRGDEYCKSRTYHYHNTIPWNKWDRDLMGLVQPVILPTLLGVGFVAGRVMIALYKSRYRQREVPAIAIESVEEQEGHSIMQKDSDARSFRWMSQSHNLAVRCF